LVDSIVKKGFLIPIIKLMLIRLERLPKFSNLHHSLVVIDDSEEMARKRERQIRDRKFAIYGTPEDVS
jgi:hypothetical protein